MSGRNCIGRIRVRPRRGALSALGGGGGVAVIAAASAEEIGHGVVLLLALVTELVVNPVGLFTGTAVVREPRAVRHGRMLVCKIMEYSGVIVGAIDI